MSSLGTCIRLFESSWALVQTRGTEAVYGSPPGHRGCVLRSLRTSAVDPTVQVSPATKMVIKGLFNTDAKPPSMCPLWITFRIKLGHWRGPRAEVGNRIHLCSQLCSAGVETVGKGPLKESLLRSWGFSGCWDLNPAEGTIRA